LYYAAAKYYDKRSCRISDCFITRDTGTPSGLIYLTDIITFLVILALGLERLILRIAKNIFNIGKNCLANFNKNLKF
jgi:hypothetical protein